MRQSSTTIVSFRAALFGLGLLVFGAPFFTSAATARPSCSLTVITPAGTYTVNKNDTEDVVIENGEYALVAWNSSDAQKAVDGTGDAVTFFGAAVHMPKKTTTYAYQFEAGARTATCAVTVHVASGTIDASSLVTSSSKPTLSGTATGTKSVRIMVYKEGSTKTFYKSKVVKIKNGAWKTRISKKLRDGTYDIEVIGAKDIGLSVIATGTLIVGTDAATNKKDDTSSATLVVESVPLLFGGTARAGASVPVAYLHVVNTGKENATLEGFWVKQNGSAATKSVIGFTSVDDKETAHGSVGGSEGATPFKNGLAFVPMEISFTPGQERLFTIKAILAGNVSSYVGTQLKIDVTEVASNASEKGVFPIRGTTWTIGY